VGDPLKDTAGPALNPMIKVTNLVSLIAAPVIVKYSSPNAIIVIVAVLLLASVVWAINRSKRPTQQVAPEAETAPGD
jgi:K(+)-stimulated pyrophosphate-energized sodium pump